MIKRRLQWMWFLPLVACGTAADQTVEPAGNQTVAQPDAGTDPVDPDPNDPPSQPQGVPLDEFIEVAASATCEAIFRCCDEQAVTDFFAPIQGSRWIQEAGLVDQLPPVATLTAESCPAVLKEVYTVQPFGKWVDAAARGLVEYDAEATSACKEALEQATCGEAVRTALFDSRCFAFGAPMSAEQGRQMFRRTQEVGASCSPLNDGTGAAFFGTCNPQTSWCCRPREDGSCGVNMDIEGECVAAADEGEPCGAMGNMRICKTGLECDFESSTCQAPQTAELALGDECYANFSLLGDCVNSYCDMMGSNICEPLRAEGEACTFPYECTTGACDAGTCATNRMCVGG